MRIAHATDIHWGTDPDPWRMGLGKRILGAANLYLRGRRHEFTEDVQSALVRRIVALEPEAVVFSGDLTGLAIPSEFVKAREALDPILSRFPSFVVPGNHDSYTPRAWGGRRIRSHFGDFMHLGDSPIGRLDLGRVTFLGIDPTRSHYTSSGLVPPEQMTALEATLTNTELRERYLILVIHYPVLSPSGNPYDHWEHGLANVRDLIALLDRAPVRPQAILHGHKHHGYRAELTLSDGAKIPTFNPGSGGYVRNEGKKKAGAFNLYTIPPGSGEPPLVERFVWNGEDFHPEAGGAYASGY